MLQCGLTQGGRDVAGEKADEPRGETALRVGLVVGIGLAAAAASLWLLPRLSPVLLPPPAATNAAPPPIPGNMAAAGMPATPPDTQATVTPPHEMGRGFDPAAVAAPGSPLDMPVPVRAPSLTDIAAPGTPVPSQASISLLFGPASSPAAVAFAPPGQPSHGGAGWSIRDAAGMPAGEARNARACAELTDAGGTRMEGEADLNRIAADLPTDCLPPPLPAQTPPADDPAALALLDVVAPARATDRAGPGTGPLTAPSFAGRMDPITLNPPFIPITSVTLQTERLRIRLFGVVGLGSQEICTRPDGPRWNCGVYGRAALNLATRGRNLTCTPVRWLNAGEVIARCQNRNGDIASAMVEAGYARVPVNGEEGADPVLAANLTPLEAAARTRTRGVWSGAWPNAR
jgi:hypothetical protein